MANRFPQLECVGFSERELARPASDLPIETLKKVGTRLQIHNGDWNIIAENLGYEREGIDVLQCQADASRSIPGISLLLDWSSQKNGRSIFVLRDVLYECGRLDCVEILDKSIREKLLCVLLYVQIEDESNAECPIFHKIKTRSDSNLRDSMENVLGGDVDKFQIVQEGLYWDKTLAKDLKGQQLILKKKLTQEKSPTLRHMPDSSTYELTSRRVEIPISMQTDHSNLNIPTDTNELHCTIHVPDQSNVVTSSSSSDSLDGQTFRKQYNLASNISTTTNKKRKMELRHPCNSDMDFENTCFVDMTSETLEMQIQNIPSAFLSTMTAVENMTEMYTTGRKTDRFEPLTSFTQEKNTKLQNDPPSQDSRFFSHNYGSGDSVSSLSEWRNHTAPSVDIHHQSPLSLRQPPALPSRYINIPPRIPSKNCEVPRNIKQEMPNDENLKQLLTELQDFPGWCLHETEDTIESSLRPVCREDGNYIIWYMRKKRSLGMSISHLKSIMHYEINVKTEGGKSTFCFYPEHKFSSLRKLIEYHKQYGLEPPQTACRPVSLPTNHSLHQITRYCHVRPKCAVRMQYTKRLR